MVFAIVPDGDKRQQVWVNRGNESKYSFVFQTMDTNGLNEQLSAYYVDN